MNFIYNRTIYPFTDTVFIGCDNEYSDQNNGEETYQSSEHCQSDGVGSGTE